MSRQQTPLSMSPMRNIWGLITNNGENKTPAALTGISSCLAVLEGHQGRVKNVFGHPDSSHTCTAAAFGAIPMENTLEIILFVSPPGSRLITGTSLAMFGFGKWAEKHQGVKAINTKNRPGVHRQCWCREGLGRAVHLEKLLERFGLN